MGAVAKAQKEKKEIVADMMSYLSARIDQMSKIFRSVDVNKSGTIDAEVCSRRLFEYFGHLNTIEPSVEPPSEPPPTMRVIIGAHTCNAMLAATAV